MNRAWIEYSCLMAFFLLVALLATWPLPLHFTSAIPCKFAASNLAIDRPGDNLQLLYWFWLLKDNLFGASSFMHNPYEFNLAAGQPSGFYLYPLYLPALLFAPLGPIVTYNSLVLLSYPLTGFCTYLLIRLHCSSRAGALVGALVYTLLPLRIINLMGGHLNGFIFYLLPAIFYFLELALRTRQRRWALLAGLLLFWLSMLEFQLIYYLILLLALILPLRLYQDERPTLRPLLDPASLFRLLLVGFALTCWWHSLATLSLALPLTTPGVGLVLGLYPLLFLFFSLVAGPFLARLTGVDTAALLRLASIALLPCLLLPLHALNHLRPVAGTGRGLSGVVLLATLILAWHQRHLLGPRSMGGSWSSAWAGLRQRAWPLWPALAGLGLAIAWLLLIKHHFLNGSIAGDGRTLQEVARFSPTLTDLKTPLDEAFPGLLVLLLVVLAFTLVLIQAVRPGPIGNRLPLLPLVAFCCLLTYLVGTGTALGPSSLYRLLYEHLPLFHYARVPDRLLTFAFLFAAILSGQALAAGRYLLPRQEQRIGVALVTCGLLGVVMAEYGVAHPVGLTILNRGQKVYQYIGQRIEDHLLLELPLWPGDSHQSSLFEYAITQDGIRRVNGYTPLVDRAYLDQVYTPLTSLNQGYFDLAQYRLLRKMGVRYITVHDNPDVFPFHLSRQPPATTLRHLMLSPLLEYLPLDNQRFLADGPHPYPGLHLFRLVSQPPPQLPQEPPPWAPVDIYPADELGHLTGRLQNDPQIKRQVLAAMPQRDQAHFLNYGPYTTYPPGNYQVCFRLKSQGRVAPETQVARLDAAAYLAHSSQKSLAQYTVLARDLAGDGYHDILLDFHLDRPKKLEFRTFFLGQTDLWLEKIMVSHQKPPPPPHLFEAEQLPGETGTVTRDTLASAGWAVQVTPRRDHGGRAVYGPYLSFGRGHYLAHFFVRAGDRGPCSEPCPIRLRVSGNDGKRVLVDSRIAPFKVPHGTYGRFTVAFDIDRTDELDFSVEVSGKSALLIDRVEVQLANSHPECQNPLEPDQGRAHHETVVGSQTPCLPLAGLGGRHL